MKKHKKQNKKRGFSLIELLIVVAIILIIAAIAIPNLLRSRIAANEASAVGSLRTLNTAEITYNTTYPNVGFACTLGSLGGSGSGTADLGRSRSDRCQPGQRHQERVQLLVPTASSGTPAPTYQTYAAPVTLGTTGQRYFCSDSSGVIQYGTTTITTCGTSTNPI